MKPVMFTDLKIGDKFIVPYLDGSNLSPWVCWWNETESMLLTKVSDDSVECSAFTRPQQGLKDRVERVLVLKVRERE